MDFCGNCGADRRHVASIAPCLRCNHYVAKAAGRQRSTAIPVGAVGSPTPGLTHNVSDGREVTFYSDERGNRITKTRAIFGARTYAMVNISSVTTGTLAPDRSAARTTIGFGAILSLLGVIGTIGIFGIYLGTGMGCTILTIGLIILVLGISAYRGQRFRYTLRIASASGESNALVSHDSKYIHNVAQALNEAIITRG